MTEQLAVSIVIPTYNEQRHLATTIDSIVAQTYPHIIEVIVADGGSTDRTRPIAQQYPAVEVVDNPGRIQAAGLNRALAKVRGDIVVRVDGHCVLAPDYVERCVAALVSSGAAMVGGGMDPAPPVGASASVQRGIAAAMVSRMGAGPARFHVGGARGWVDTVYLGAYRTADARAVGGYAEDVGVNEDAEFAIRMSARGGVWYDPDIRSTYVPRASYRALVQQFFRYGRSRAKTVARHPDHLRLRQLVAPALVLGLLSPKRRWVATAYASALAVRGARELATHPDRALAFTGALPLMHLSWGTGFLFGFVSPPNAPAPGVHGAQLGPAEWAPVDREREPFTPGA